MGTTLVPGRPAPTLITAYKVRVPGSQGLRDVLQVTPLGARAQITVYTLPTESIPGTLSFSAGGTGWMESADSATLYQTTQSGRTWHRIELPRPPSPALYADVTAPGVGWYSTGQRLWRTTTAGHTWTAIALPAWRGERRATDEIAHDARSRWP